MEIEETDIIDVSSYEESSTAVNNLILDYYKKFGRKRDLEQFFSLSTAQNEVRDPCSMFWRRMKSQDDSSDSGGKKSESSTELCRISIKCSVSDPSSSQVEQSRVKSDSESPPIIREDVTSEPLRISDSESVKSEDIQKSIDGTFDTSTNKPHSPTSSITSQRKLEWDSLADVGYANESDRKNSASSLSTLERMALHQQYSNNDTKNNDLGQPTAQSTPCDVSESHVRNKKCFVRKTTKIYKKDIDSVELSVPQNSETNPHPINLNLTKHISFNVDGNGSVLIENISKNISLSPEKVSVETEVTPQIKYDKEIQTTLNKNDKSCNSDVLKDSVPHVKRYPVLISLNSLKKKSRKKKSRRVKRQQSKKKIVADKENITSDKHESPLSKAESFEYMPGHIYNRNHLQNRNNSIGNKSSLESSGLTTDSSKTTKYSFAKDLEKSIDLLKSTLDYKHADVNLRKKLIKEIVQRLIEPKNKDDKNSTEFLSGLSFNSKRLGLTEPNNCTTTSTSDANNTDSGVKFSKPKKSILRMDSFNTNALASTSQSVPNLPTYTKNERNIKSTILKQIELSNTDSDNSNRNKSVSDVAVEKTSSEELYKKYLEALKREQAYKRHLKEKEIFLKQKLVSSDVAFNVIRQVDPKSQNRIKDLMKDLIRNNYDDGSGDASKLEGGSSSHTDMEKMKSVRKQRSHSVFTLSSGISENKCKSGALANKTHYEAGASKKNSKFEKHFCCCPFHSSQPKVGMTDSSVQVNIQHCKDPNASGHKAKDNLLEVTKSPGIESVRCEKCKNIRNKTQIVTDCVTDDVKYVCLCTADDVVPQDIPENFLLYKCSRLPSKMIKMGDMISKDQNIGSGCSTDSTSHAKISSFKSHDCDRKCLVIKDSNSSNNLTSKSSQTNVNLPIVIRGTTSCQSTSSSELKLCTQNVKQKVLQEATRCIQTEISIDPKKSDPSLSDIHIVNDINCAKLINEGSKEVRKPTSLDENNKFNTYCCQIQSNENNVPEVKQNVHKETKCDCANVVETTCKNDQKFDKNIQSAPDHITNDVHNQICNDIQSAKNFTIPIQGTNMTLKVSLGSTSEQYDTTRLAKDLKNGKTSYGTETMKIPAVDNCTSLQEECSKGVQSSNTNVVEEVYRKPDTPCCGKQNSDNEKSNKLTEKATSNFTAKSCYVNTCMTDYKYNTYPTNDRSNIQKPLLRSNTDPTKLEKCHVTFHKKSMKDFGNQPDLPQKKSKPTIIQQEQPAASCCSDVSSKSVEMSCKSKLSSDTDKLYQFRTSSSETDGNTKIRSTKDPLIEVIQDITKRYSKNDVEKNRRKKCFKEIITVLNYLLDTEESTDQNKASCSSACEDICDKNLPPKTESGDSMPRKTLADKAIQLSAKKSKSRKTCTESSDFAISTDIPSTSSDTATCKVLNKIKKECEKYHQKRCKVYVGGKKCEVSSSTSVNCDQCRRVHYCPCKGHKCKGHRTKTVEKTKKKCVAYNLIIQTSDSIVSEEINCGNNRRQLQNIIVKVPSKRKVENVPFKEMASKIERDMSHCSPRCNIRVNRSKSLPNDSEISSTDDVMKKGQNCTVREFLEKNRPDFIQRCSNRQDCLKLINESRPRESCSPRLNMIVVHPRSCNGISCMETCNMCYGGVPLNNCNACPYNNVHCVQNDITGIASERAAKRKLLSMQLEQQKTLTSLSESNLKDFAREVGHEMRRKKVAPKFISEREMKKHSEKIYKSLPEVLRKKEDAKKENSKKTNLLMANIFKKNLQKKTLSGAVNISNYSAVIKI